MSSNKRFERFLEAYDDFREGLDRGLPYDLDLLRELFGDWRGKLFPTEERECPFHRVLVLLPSNVPMVLFQMAPLLLSYPNVTFTFKLSSGERELIPRFLGLWRDSRMEVLLSDRERTRDLAGGYDFLVGFGSSELEPFLRESGKPYRFFGPRFSLALLPEPDEDQLRGLFKDVLAFDTQGCLCPRFLFTGDPSKLPLSRLWEEACRRRPPQKGYDPLLFRYSRAVLLLEGKGDWSCHDGGLFQVERIPSLFPPRTLFLVSETDPERVLTFLGESVSSVQGIVTPQGESHPLLGKETSASLFSPPGGAQHPPSGWLFERGVTLENFFTPQQNR